MKKLLLILLMFPCYLSGQSIRGFITDNNTGLPLMNVTILLQGTNQGTASDSKGSFILEIQNTGAVTLVVSHIGFETKIVKLRIQENGISGLSISLKPSITLISETVITATRTKRKISEIPASVILFNQDQIKEMPVTAVDDLLRTEASINVDRKNGIFSKNASVNMRGLNSSARTLVMLDGVPLNKADGGGVNWNRINTEGIEQIEIVKGPGSALYGGNAMGGVVNVISKDIQDKTTGSVKIALGSCNTQSAQVWLSGNTKKLPKLGWNINSFYRRGDGYIIAPSNVRDSTDAKTYLWEYNAGGKLVYRFSDSVRIEAGYNYFDDKRGDGIQVYDPEGGYNKYRTNHAFVNLHANSGRTMVVANAYMQFENYMNQKEQIKTDKLPPYAVTQYVLYLVNSHRNDAGMWVSATTNAGKTHKLTYGIDIRLSSANASDIYFTSTDTITNKGKLNAYALFMQDEVSFLHNRLKLIAGVRADAVFFRDASFTIAAPSATNSYMMEYAGKYDDKDWLAFSPKIGLHYTLSGTNTIYLNYSVGFRPGTLDDMCRSGSISKGFKMANPELEPENISSYEIGSSFSINKFMKLESAIYYSLGRKFQYFVGTGDTIYSASKPKPILKRENVSKAAVSGAEATLIFKPITALSLSLSYAYNHSVIKDFDTVRFIAKDLSGKFLMEVPQNRFTAMASWKNKYFSTMLAYEYTGSLFIDDENLVELPAYYSIDAKISRLFATHYFLSLTVQNLSNNIYIDNKGNLGISRFIMLEAAYRF